MATNLLILRPAMIGPTATAPRAAADWGAALWPLHCRCERLARRAMELIVAGGALLAAAPLMLVLALCIVLTDRGPVLFWQTRIGKHGRPFAFPKFRSMVVGADRLKDGLAAANQRQDGVTFKIRRDPRATWIGLLMRRWSLDELPQLWCVVVGSMALVGPRPAVPREIAVYSIADRRRLAAEPGITCLWQVSGRADIAFPLQVELDHRYAATRSLLNDLGILLRTVPAVLGGKGAY